MLATLWLFRPPPLAQKSSLSVSLSLFPNFFYLTAQHLARLFLIRRLFRHLMASNATLSLYTKRCRSALLWAWLSISKACGKEAWSVCCCFRQSLWPTDGYMLEQLRAFLKWMESNSNEPVDIQSISWLCNVLVEHVRKIRCCLDFLPWSLGVLSDSFEAAAAASQPQSVLLEAALRLGLHAVSTGLLGVHSCATFASCHWR